MSTAHTKTKKTKTTKPTKAPAPPPASPPKPGPVAHDLDSLATHLGPHDEDFAARTFATTTEAVLVERGTATDSQNILDDMPLFIASALEITQSLTPSQRALIRLPQTIYPLLVHETIVLRGMKSDHDAFVTSGAADKADRATQERAARLAGIALRDSVYDALRSALGSAAVTELDIVTGSAPSTSRLITGLTSMAAFIDRKSALSPTIAASLDDYRVGPACADSLRKLARDLAPLAKVTATPGRRISQRALDHQDGRALHLIERIVRAFRAARRIDPTILQPTLNKLAWIFDTRTKGRPTPEVEEEVEAGTEEETKTEGAKATAISKGKAPLPA